MPRFVRNSAPELIVEKMDFLWDAHSNANPRLRNGKSASRKIRRITDLLGDLQNVVARGFFDATAPVQSAIHRADGHVCHFGDAVDSVFSLAHLSHSAIWRSAIPHVAFNAYFYSRPAPARKIQLTKCPISFSCSEHPS